MKLKMLCATAAIPMAMLTGCWSESTQTPPPPGSYGYNACGEAYTDSPVLNQVKDTSCELRQQTSRQTQPPARNPTVRPTAPSTGGSSSYRDPCGSIDTDRDGVGDLCDYTDDRDNDGDGIPNSRDPWPNDYDNDNVSDGRDTTIGKDSDFDGKPDIYDPYPFDGDRK